MYTDWFLLILKLGQRLQDFEQNTCVYETRLKDLNHKIDQQRTDYVLDPQHSKLLRL